MTGGRSFGGDVHIPWSNESASRNGRASSGWPQTLSGGKSPIGII